MTQRNALELWQGRWTRSAATYAAAIALCMFLLALVLRLDLADLEVPFGYGGDALLHSILVKSIIENGWVWHNPFLGAPYGAQLLDFPFYDNLNLALIKLIAMFSSNYGTVLNLFFLLAFPLTVVCTLLAVRSFNISYPSALVAALLFAFLPFHFQRGEGHLFVGVYFLVPLMAMVVLWVWTAGPTDGGQSPQHYLLTRGQMLSSAIICALIGSSFPYYAFFGGYFLCVAGIVSAIRCKRAAHAAWGIGLAALIFAVLVVNDSPGLLYAMRHGRNMVAGQRTPAQAEVFGLKMTHLLLPVSGHRLEFLRNIRQTYDQATFSYEGATASLGMAGDVGFIFLLGWLFSSPQRWAQTELISAVALLTLSAVLLGTIGGLGALFNFFVSPQIRAYNRISIYIAFFCLFAIAFLLDALRRWMGSGTRATYLWYGLLGVVLCLGILDQTIPSFAPDYPSLKSRFQGEQDFVARIEASVPPGAMIFELPNVPFPETHPIAQMEAYDELRGYLHARSLRWSAGAMKGRPEALWPQRNGLDLGYEEGQASLLINRRIALRLPPQALSTLTFAGFSGIYIDRQGFWDLGASIISQLQSLLGEAPIESEDGRYAFFNLSTFAKELHQKYSPEQWEAQRRKTLELSPSKG